MSEINENIKTTYTAEEFKAFCKEMAPHLNAILDTAKKNGADGYVRITINTDGYVSLEGGCFNGWELARYPGSEEYVARYSYSERFMLG